MAINQSLKCSYYNFVARKRDGSIVIYNTRTGALSHSTDEVEAKNIESILSDPNMNSELGKLMYDLGYLVDVQLNETKKLVSEHIAQNDRTEKLHLTILPTKMCNFDCEYCFVDIDTKFVMGNKTLSAIKEYIQNKLNDNNGFKTLEVVWFGGEPLLEKGKMIEFMYELTSLCNLRGVNLKSVIMTNGYLLNPETFIELFESGITNFQVTFDGDHSSHDLTRKLKDGSKTFAHIYTNLIKISRRYVDLNFVINVRSNFMDSNLRTQKSLTDMFVEDFGSDDRFSLSFKPILNINDSTKMKVCSVKKANDMRSEFIKHLNAGEAEKKSSSDVSMLLPRPITRWCNVAAKDAIIINPDGEVHVCDSCLSKSDRSVGKLREGGYIEYSSMIDEWRGMTMVEFSESKCYNCKLLPTCFGGCHRKRKFDGGNNCPFTNEFVMKILTSVN